MHIPFEDISDQARIWIYQAGRKLSEEEESLVAQKSASFLEQWAAHSKPLTGSVKIFHQQFLVIAVDEQFNAVSGCSIDASVEFVRQLEQELMTSFFDRNKIAFVNTDKPPDTGGQKDSMKYVSNEAIFLEPLTKIKQLVLEGKIKENTLTFNNLVSHKKDLEKNWIVPAKDSWLSRYF